jgi:membrane-associated phospholipid phosphatase
MSTMGRIVVLVCLAMTSARVAAAQVSSSETKPVSPGDSERATSIEPKPVEPPPPGRTRFEAEPVRDGAVIAIALGFGGILALVNSTGEINPQQISRTFQTDDLLPIDRGAVTQTFSSSASAWSNVGLIAAFAYAVADPIATGYRESHRQSAIVDAIIYAQSLAVTWSVTDLSKIAVRRPRPRAYQEAEANKDNPDYMNFETDTALSFFSGHASLCAAVTSTATYLAFARSPHSARPWLTLLGGTAVTTFVGYNRVRSGAHFPTDVIAGTLAGAGVGLLVPHFHRAATEKQRPVWIGYVPEGRGRVAGLLTLSGAW